MKIKKHHSGEMVIDYSRSSVQVFHALSELGNSDTLYFKFSKNRFKYPEPGQVPRELVLDFDLCLINRKNDDTVMQLFAIFQVSAPEQALKEFVTVKEAINFGKEMLTTQIEEDDLKDAKGGTLRLPEFDINPDSIRFFD
jgi:hypothetical protein